MLTLLIVCGSVAAALITVVAQWELGLFWPLLICGIICGLVLRDIRAHYIVQLATAVISAYAVFIVWPISVFILYMVLAIWGLRIQYAAFRVLYHQEKLDIEEFAHAYLQLR